MRNTGAGSLAYLTQRSREQTNDNPGARNTKHYEKEHGAEENLRKEHRAKKTRSNKKI